MERKKKNGKDKVLKKLILALGEGSHTHLMESKEEITLLTKETFIRSEELSFVLEDLGIITHEEHDRIVLDPGKYNKYPQQEYDPFSKNYRPVFD